MFNKSQRIHYSLHRGRRYSCHFATICARLVSNGAAVSFERTTDGVYCRRELRFSAAAQSQHRLLRIQLAQRKIPYTLVANGNGTFPLEFNCEQTPSASNRVSLTDGTDQHGVKRAQVHWRLDSGDVDSALRGFLLLRERVSARSHCRLELDEEQLHTELAASAPIGGHHLGTARMAGSPRCGVVDPNCSVFGLPNLFVASSAVFLTSGFANPTLAIVALAVRLAPRSGGTQPSA